MDEETTVFITRSKKSSLTAASFLYDGTHVLFEDTHRSRPTETQSQERNPPRSRSIGRFYRKQASGNRNVFIRGERGDAHLDVHVTGH